MAIDDQDGIERLVFHFISAPCVLWLAQPHVAQKATASAGVAGAFLQTNSFPYRYDAFSEVARRPALFGVLRLVGACALRAIDPDQAKSLFFPSAIND